MFGGSSVYIPQGSPPHTRGTRFNASSISVNVGITPAYAGNTALPASLCDVCRDHPRIRGEHQNNDFLLSPLLGSPPHTRGTPGLEICPQVLWRITPAYAGNTSLISYNTSMIQDHPRIRGEHCSLNFIIFSIIGSPPHTRRTLFTSSSLIASIRITPAYAGNTHDMATRVRRVGDHPRIRGEHL